MQPQNHPQQILLEIASIVLWSAAHLHWPV
jgi:hypothetical protein